MKVGIIQPNYIPWRGYFDLIDDCDCFVFYDDVQYTARDWRNRNKIKTEKGLQWLSVPVRHDRGTLIRDARISYQDRWIAKHVRSMALAYSKSPYLREYGGELFDILRTEFETISMLNVALCKWIMAKLCITTPTRLSSEFGIRGDKFDRPLEVLKLLGATAYLSGPAAKPYTDHRKFQQAGISLEYKTYDYGPYRQLHGSFEPRVTVLDLLFNVGPDARSHLKSLTPNERMV